MMRNRKQWTITLSDLQSHFQQSSKIIRTLDLFLGRRRRLQARQAKRAETRRAQIISRLTQTISERQVQGGLRRTLLTQARRLRQLTEARYLERGGESIVEKGSENASEEGEQ